MEELDVKLKTLEAEGVEVEKKLRGEGKEIVIIHNICTFIIFWVLNKMLNYCLTIINLIQHVNIFSILS